MEDKKDNIMDLTVIVPMLLKRWKLYALCMAGAIVFSLIFVFTIPRYYACKVMLAPEATNNNNGLNSLMNSFGLGDMETTDDAISPKLYPDLMTSNDFIVSMFPVEITTKDGELTTTYYDYLLHHNKSSWYEELLGNLAETLKSKDNDKCISELKGKTFPTAFLLTDEQHDIANLISNKIQYDYDKKTGVISVTVKDQDPLVCALIADTVSSRLQDYVYDSAGNFMVDPNTGYRMKEFGDSLGVKALDRMQTGMTHNFQIGLPNFTLFKYINVTPSVSYGQNWMFSAGSQKLVDVYDSSGNPVMVTDKDGNLVQAQQIESDPGTLFNHFGITQTYSGSMSMSTRIYGMFNFGKHKRLQALRHVVTPSLSLNFSPEKGTSFNGWRTLPEWYDSRGTYHAESYYNIYSINGNRNLSSPPGRGKTGGMSFSLGNNLEAKVRNLRDTTGTGSKKVKILDQLNFSGSYNFLADSLKLSNIGVTMSTSIFGKLGVNGNLNFDPYAIDDHGRKINKFQFTTGGFPLRLTNASASLSYSINGKGTIDGNDGRSSGSGGGDANSYQRIYYHPITGEYIPGGYVYYMNPNSPWSLNLSYSFNYARSYQYSNNQLITNNRITQTLNMSGNIKLTPRLSIQATSGFDVMAMKLTTTQISATYDLHCFNIAVSWVPTGQWQSYSFRIAANASALADLLRFKKSSSYWDN